VASGPPVFLEPATAQILALTLHELATNAAKYGALSTSDGDVRLTWHLTTEGLTLNWLETGGPSVQPPAARGYGTKVISASIDRQLGGRATFEWLPSGLRFVLSIPCGDKTKASEDAQNRSPSDEAMHAPGLGRVLAGTRLLLVEDEALVGMMMKDMLTDLGFQVTGPCARVADALAVAGQQEFHGALLDVNLDGEMVYPVAEALQTQGVPFVFVTGYGAEGIDRRFAQIPVLQKPIDAQMLQSIFVKSVTGSDQASRRPQVKRKANGNRRKSDRNDLVHSAMIARASDS
jgi:CheY-like chemotaxis protein